MKTFDTRSKKRTRHAGIESAIQIPFENRILSGSIVATKCGKYLRCFDRAVNTNLRFTDGSVYSTLCAVCFPE